MGKKSRVGGSGWAGLKGSFVGIGREVSGKGQRSKAKRPKPKHPEYRGFSDWIEANAAGLSKTQWQQQCEKNVREIENQYASAKAVVKKLKKELILAEKARVTAFRTKTADQTDSSD